MDVLDVEDKIKHVGLSVAFEVFIMIQMAILGQCCRTEFVREGRGELS